MRALPRLLLPVTLIVAAFCLYEAFVANYSGDASHLKSAGMGALAWAGFAFNCFRIIQAARAKHAAYLQFFEGLPLDEALALAREEAMPIAPALVADKVKIPFSPWSAFEHEGFKFVIAPDENGKAQTFGI